MEEVAEKLRQARPQSPMAQGQTAQEHMLRPQFTTEVPVMRGMTDAVQAVHTNWCGLVEDLTLFVERLTPVLRPAPPSDAGIGQANRDLCSPLAGHLYAWVDEIQEARALLERLSQRLDL